MGGSEGIELALAAQGEAVKPALLADRAHAFAAAGENLVRVSLVAHVPDQAVGGRIKNVMQRDGQFDHAEAGAEMAAGDRSGIDGFGAQFVGQLAGSQGAQFLNGIDAVEQRCRKMCQAFRPYSPGRPLPALFAAATGRGFYRPRVPVTT